VVELLRGGVFGGDDYFTIGDVIYIGAALRRDFSSLQE
jgi:hypothetical protein